MRRLLLAILNATAWLGAHAQCSQTINGSTSKLRDMA